MRVASRGCTIAEALVAVVVLTVGVMALLGSSALVNRMIGLGRWSTTAAQVAGARIERLNRIAVSSAPPCSGVEWRTDSVNDPGLSQSWQVLDPAGLARRVRVVVRSRRPGGSSSDTVVTAVFCGPP